MIKQLRYWLKGLTTFLLFPIAAGPLRGYWWGLFCGMRYLRGTYDARDVARLKTLISPGGTFYDVGAHVGYYAMVVSLLLGEGGQVVAFEPLVLNLRFIRQHLRSNRVHNIVLVPAAVGEQAGEASFDLGKGTGRGFLGAASGERVPVVSIDQTWLEGTGRPPDLIKMDIEGGELAALKGARRSLREHRPLLMLAVHSEELRRDCSDLLAALDYALVWFKPNGCIAVPAERPEQLAAVRADWERRPELMPGAAPLPAGMT